MTKLLETGTLTSTNAYVTVAEVDLFSEKCRNIEKVSIYVKENNVNAIKYKIEATIDGTNYFEIKAEATLAKNAGIDFRPSQTGYEDLGDPVRKIRVQHKADVADAQGNTTVTIVG